MTPAHAQLLGGAQVRLDSGWIHLRPQKRYQLLVFLAYQGDWVNREQLIYLFWADLPEKAARRNLRQTLHKLTKLPWLRGLEAEGQRLRWAVTTDVAAFHQAFREEAWDEAVSLYRGPLLEAMDEVDGTEFSTWLALERDQLQAHWREALLKWVARLEEDGYHEQAASLLSRLLAHDDLDEEALRRYMVAAARAGRPEQALRAYRAFEARLAAELQLEPTRASRELNEAIRKGDTLTLSSVAPWPDPAREGELLPMEVSSFVGRKLELVELGNLLAQPGCRLLTLIGAGGVGKSRIALQAARVLADRYEHGVCFVSLEALANATMIPAKIAERLRVALHGKDEPLSQLKRHLADRRLLLILDNFEHLVEGVPLIYALLRHCPRLQVLVSSRERLALEEEWLLPIGGLPFPEAPVTREEAKRYEAVELFEQRARRIRPDFRADETEFGGVLEICRLVEGLPLGIELAAVWVRLMSCAEIAQEIRQNIDFLRGSSRNLPSRHQSIRATFEHSWHLLTPSEQDVLRQLSVFLGGFRKEAAGYVTGASLPVLASLLDKSLLRVTRAGRYDRHPLLYQYTSTKLSEHPGEAEQVRDRHSGYYLALLEPHGGRSHHDILTFIDEELDNVLLAWRRAIAQRKWELLEPASEALARYFEMKGRFREGVDYLDEARVGLTENTASERRLLGHLRMRQAWLEHWLVNERAAELAREGLRLLRPLREHAGIAGGLRVLGVIAWRAGDYRQAEGYFREALTLVATPDLLELKAILLDALGLVFSALGDYAEAERSHRDALTINVQHGHRFQAVHNLVNLASFSWRVADPKTALGFAEQALALAQETGFKQYLPFCLSEAGWSRLALHEHQEAKALGIEAFVLAKQHGDTFALTLSLLLAAQANIELNDLAEAERLSREALAIAWSIQDLILVLRALRVAASLALRQGKPEQAALLLAQVMHHPASPHWNVMEAEWSLALARERLDAKALARAQDRGKSMPLEDMVAELLTEGRS